MEEQIKIFLQTYNEDDILDMMNSKESFYGHFSIYVSLAQLKIELKDIYSAVLSDTWSQSSVWNQCILQVQKIFSETNLFLDSNYTIKPNCHARFVNMLDTESNYMHKFPTIDHIGEFVQLKGTVIKMTTKKIIDIKREYVCSQCRTSFTAEAEYRKFFIFDIKYPCIVCRNAMKPRTSELVPDFCMDYKEVVIQGMHVTSKTPALLVVSLDNDLVDSCQPGDSVIVCGTIETRWKPLIDTKKLDIVMTMRANSVCDAIKMNFEKNLHEKLALMESNWKLFVENVGEQEARDFVIKSFLPKIHGMHPVKLAIALSLCSSGIERMQYKGMSIRRHSHLLICGDPGIAKSKLLSYAAQISLRSVQTTGMGCTSAGLTAGAYKENNEWQLEAGALVLADGGICCIDEFNLMREADKASIHETMEQQTISIAKANIVCKLSTRCVILATMNPKTVISGDNVINIASPLLSRFDIVLMLLDKVDPVWDQEITDDVLSTANVSTNRTRENKKALWSIEQLRYHFLCAKKINPTITASAYHVLAEYFKWCRADPYRNPARTTIRLLDSLTRLAQSNAKLVLRSEVTIVDAVNTVRLMESSYGFGRLITPINLIKDKIPLGPTTDQILEVLSALQLEHLMDEIDTNFTVQKDIINNNKTVFELDDNVENLMVPKKRKKLNCNSQENVSVLRSSASFMDDNELNEIINFDEIEKKLKNNSSNEKSTIDNGSVGNCMNKEKSALDDSVACDRRSKALSKEYNSNRSSANESDCNSSAKAKTLSARTLDKLNVFRSEGKTHIKANSKAQNVESSNSFLAKISEEANKILNDNELDFDLGF